MATIYYGKDVDGISVASLAELGFAYMKQFGATGVNETPGKPQGFEETGSVSRDIPGLGLSAQLTARIADFENVCGIKVSRPLPHYAEVKKLCGDKIVLSHPSETEYLTLMRDHGMRVHMSSAAPFLMQTASWKPMHEYSELGLAGRFDEAQKIGRAHV